MARHADHSSDFWAVLCPDELRAVLERQRLGLIEIYKEGTYRQSYVRNDGIKFSKIEWTLQLPAAGVEGVNIHFESRERGELQLDVEVAPYEGSIDSDPDRAAELRKHIELRSRLVQMIRDELAADTDLRERFGVTTKWLRDPQVAPAVCAVKFTDSMTAPSSPNTDATFFAKVMDQVAPLLDQLVKRAKKELM